MRYREYGQTGKMVSLLSFGGMRFADIDDRDECVGMMVTAAEGGINYFDTAPGYCDGKSEAVLGAGFAELRRRNLPFYSATKTFASDGDAIRREIDAQLKRMDVPAVDFYHIWSVCTLENWRERRKNGILQTFAKLREEGLIRHVCVSSHLINNEIGELLMEGVFEGVLFGYSAYNFRARQSAFDAIRGKKLGAVVMNPLGGGVIPRNGDLFAALCRPGETAAAAALRFLWDHPDVTSTLVGFDNAEQIRDALAAMESYEPRTGAELEALKSGALAAFDGICTGCAYCDDCPEGIPVPKFMDVYNQKILHGGDGGDSIANRLKWHWRLDRSLAAECTACGHCEDLCTQHIEIIKRLQEIAG